MRYCIVHPIMLFFILISNSSLFIKFLAIKENQNYIRYQLESKATLYSLPESPYVHFEHIDF